MHNIGNDIVDLNLAETQSNWQRKGFLEKQFTEKEQGEILKSECPFLKVWQFWSMKEAAYKCYTQKIEKRFFAPQKFECSLTEEGKGFVTFDNSKFFTTTFFNTFYMHTIAEDNFDIKNDQIRIYFAIGSPKTIDKNLKKKLQDETGILSEEIEKRKTVIGAPLFYHHQKLITKSCSIAHHGNYGAFGFILNNET